MAITPQQPAEDQSSILAALSSLFQGAQQPQSDMSSLFSEALSANEARQPPAAQPVPGGTNPFGGMAAIFAASLAQQMGSTGALAQTQAQLEANEAARASATHENHAREQAFDDKKAFERMGILMKIGEAKAKALERGEDADAYEKQVKANMMIADRARKLQEDIDARQAEQAHKNRLEEIMAKPRVTVEEKKAAADEKAVANDTKATLKFQEDISSIAKKPGSMQKDKEGSWILGQQHVVTNMTTAGLAQTRGRAAAVASSARTPMLQEAALSTYLDTFRDAQGQINVQDPGWKRFEALLLKVFPKLEDRNAFLTSAGL